MAQVLVAAESRVHRNTCFVVAAFAMETFLDREKKGFCFREKKENGMGNRGGYKIPDMLGPRGQNRDLRSFHRFAPCILKLLRCPTCIFDFCLLFPPFFTS